MAHDNTQCLFGIMPTFSRITDERRRTAVTALKKARSPKGAAPALSRTFTNADAPHQAGSVHSWCTAPQKGKSPRPIGVARAYARVQMGTCVGRQTDQEKSLGAFWGHFCINELSLPSKILPWPLAILVRVVRLVQKC